MTPREGNRLVRLAVLADRRYGPAFVLVPSMMMLELVIELGGSCLRRPRRYSIVLMSRFARPRFGAAMLILTVR